jgi:multiple sugar transport system substrate-binding protein
MSRRDLLRNVPPKEISRRDMLKMAGLGVAGTVVVAACQAKQEGPTKMTVVHRREYFREMEELYAAAVTEWAKENNVEMEVSTVAAEAFEDFVAKMVAAVKAGSPPDLVYHIRLVQQLYFVDALEKVTDTVNEAIKMYGKPPYEQEVENLIEGDWWGIPFTVHGGGWFTRRDVFEANGIDVTTLKTYDEWRDACLTVSDPPNEMYGWGFTVNRSGDGRGLIEGVIQHWGGHYTDAGLTKLTFNSPETVAAVQWLTDIYAGEKWAKMLPPGIMAWTDMSNNEAYLAGNIAATSNAASVYAKAKADGNPVFEDTYVPWPPVGPTGEELIGGGGGQHNILKGAKEQELAKELALHMLKPEVFVPISLISAGLFLPAYHKYYEMDEVKKEFEAAPNLQTMGQMAQGNHPGSSWPAEPNAFFDAIAAENVLCDMLQRTITDGISPADAVKEAEDRIAQIAEEMQVF